MPYNNSQSQQDRARDTWMRDTKQIVYAARNNLKASKSLEAAEYESLLGSGTPTVLLDKVQVNPVNPVIRVSNLTAWNHSGVDKNQHTFNYPGAFGTALIKGDGRGSLTDETLAIIVPNRQEAPRGNRRETADEMSVRHAMNDQLSSIFAEEGLLESAKVVQARMIIPAIHTHEDGTMKACVYILADNVFPEFRGRLEYSRTDFMSAPDQLPEVGEDEEPQMDDEMVAALTA